MAVHSVTNLQMRTHQTRLSSANCRGSCRRNDLAEFPRLRCTHRNCDTFVPAVHFHDGSHTEYVSVSGLAMRSVRGTSAKLQTVPMSRLEILTIQPFLRGETNNESPAPRKIEMPCLCLIFVPLYSQRPPPPQNFYLSFYIL